VRNNKPTDCNNSYNPVSYIDYNKVFQLLPGTELTGLF